MISYNAQWSCGADRLRQSTYLVALAFLFDSLWVVTRSAYGVGRLSHSPMHSAAHGYRPAERVYMITTLFVNVNKTNK